MDVNVGHGCIDQEGKGLGWGKSLPVQSVQELVRKNYASVPERYIQENNDRPWIHSQMFQASSLDQIPVIEFSSLAKGDEHEITKLDLACKEWGFFHLTNHGVEVKVMQKMKAAMAAFFELPLTEKKKYAMAANDLHGYGQAFVISEQQKLDWCDILVLKTLPLQDRSFNFWPLTLPGFKEAVEEYSIQVHKVGEEINANLSALMGIEREGLKRLHGDLKQLMRMNYYPPCSRPDLVLGVSPHSDGASLTLLLQDDDVIGLQIKHKGEWIPIKPIPNSFVVNIGDATEIFSNGVYKSIEHRAITNEKKARISVATFVHVDEEEEIGPVDSMVDHRDRPPMYKKVKYIDFIREAFARKLEGKAHTDMLKIQTM